MSTPDRELDPIIEQERAHENAWYTRALRERFFEREGFRRLVSCNVAAFRRQVPLRLSGNVLQLPGRTLFVTEACSGLRSLTALLALGVLIAGLWLRLPVLRVLLVLLAIPIAVLLNGVRVFLTGFLVHFVDPRMGDGFMHMTEGWVMFVIAFALLGGIAWLLIQAERLWKVVR